MPVKGVRWNTRTRQWRTHLSVRCDAIRITQGLTGTFLRRVRPWSSRSPGEIHRTLQRWFGDYDRTVGQLGPIPPHCRWHRFGLVVAGLFLGDQVFDRLGFGPDDGAIVSDDARHYLRLVYAILGSVIVGWMLTIAALVVGPIRRREAWAWNTVAGGVGAWFVLDTGFSLVLGFVGHAAFNVAFAAALAAPLIAIKRELRDRADPSN